MIEIRNISKTYDNGSKALKDIDIRIQDGEFVFIMRRSGSGEINPDPPSAERRQSLHRDASSLTIWTFRRCRAVTYRNTAAVLAWCFGTSGL